MSFHIVLHSSLDTRCIKQSTRYIWKQGELIATWSVANKTLIANQYKMHTVVATISYSLSQAIKKEMHNDKHTTGSGILLNTDFKWALFYLLHFLAIEWFKYPWTQNERLLPTRHKACNQFMPYFFYWDSTTIWT